MDEVQFSAGKELFLADAKDLDPKSFRRLVTRRARQLVAPVKPLLVENEDQRRDLEGQIEAHFEKIHMGADFLPARFLEEGAKRSRAVCRIVVRTSRGRAFGTGFLVASGVLMTNNHVLSSEEEAEASVAEFDFQKGAEVTRVALEPERLFFTSEDLDFTLVACEDQLLEGIEPIPLLRNPATITRHERVNIIQHPQGRPKEVALHENRITRVKDKVIHYQTDTEPGSSGSPLFNNEWDLVGLHHAGWTEGNTATNEGIRVSAIVARLLNSANESASNRERLEVVLESIPDTSPYLGFFDTYGIGDPEQLEIELPDFTGSAAFADVGVWNIEHFNDRVSDQRINDVADVVGRLAIDVLGLTEVQQGALDRLATALGRQGFDIGHSLLDVRGSQDLAVLYDRDTTSVKRRDDIALRHEERLNAKTPSGRTAFPRYPLFIECTVGGDDEREVKFLMVVVHFKAFGDVQSQARRRLAAKMLAEIIEDVRERDDLAVVLGGDFNERLDTDVLGALKASPDLFAMTADDATTDAISYVGRSHRSLIDHILVSRDVLLGDISGDDAAIVRLDQSIRDFADRVSDHVPVVFRMVYRDEPADVPLPGAVEGLTVPIPEGAKSVQLHFEGE